MHQFQQHVRGVAFQGALLASCITQILERERERDERFPLFLWFLASDADSSLAHFTRPHLSNWQTPIHSSRPSLNIS